MKVILTELSTVAVKDKTITTKITNLAAQHSFFKITKDSDEINNGCNL